MKISSRSGLSGIFQVSLFTGPNAGFVPTESIHLLSVKDAMGDWERLFDGEFSLRPKISFDCSFVTRFRLSFQDSQSSVRRCHVLPIFPRRVRGQLEFNGVGHFSLSAYGKWYFQSRKHHPLARD